MNAVFLDTVGLIAHWDKTDQWHVAAAAVLQELVSRNCPVVTTSSVLLECGNAAARRPYRLAINRLRTNLESGGMLITPNEQDWRLAWEAYCSNDGAGAGIVDQISFIVMRQLGIKQVFSNDEHFRAAGFETLF